MSLKNRENFLQELASKFKILKPSDWGKITNQEICSAGGKSLLRNYNNSLFSCLQSTFKGEGYSLLDVTLIRNVVEARMVS